MVGVIHPSPFKPPNTRHYKKKRNIELNILGGDNAWQPHTQMDI